MDIATHRLPKMQLEDWLDDLCVRFIINLPPEDLSSVSRICFQVEEAQWFYEDFIRPLDHTLPSMSLRTFCLRIFQHCPLLASFSVENHMKAFEEFMQYKTRIPVRGAILMNEAMDSTVLVKGWKKGASWSFPRGKINKDEDDLDCAIREVYEETGFDVREAGLVPEKDEVKYIEISIRQNQVRLYVFRNVPMDTVFEPKTRKEISKVAWYRLSQLPAFRKNGANPYDESSQPSGGKFYMVAPFLPRLKKWAIQQKKKDSLKNPTHLMTHPSIEETLTEDDMGAQTDAAVAPPRLTPAIDTFEGATRELQRLLKVQPPAAGLSVPPPESQSQDRGGALLAMLQRSSGQQQPAPAAATSLSSQQQQAFPPQTPLEHTVFNPPEPHTPHHLPGQRMPLASYAAPPNFPVPPHQMHPQMGMPHQVRHQPLPGPHPAYANHPGSLADLPHPAPSGPRAGPGHHGMPPLHAAYAEQNMSPGHPQHIPLQAHKLPFNLSGLPMGGLVDPAAGASQPGVGSQPPQVHGVQGGRPQYAPENVLPSNMLPQNAAPQNMAPQSQLNNHKLSLLSAFKSPDVNNGQPTAFQAQIAQAPRLPLQAQSQPSAMPNPIPHPQQAASMGPAAHTASRGQQPQSTHGGAQLPFIGVPHPAPATEKHRNSLLDMFKQAPQTSLADQVKITSSSVEPTAPLGTNSAQPMAQPSSTRHAIEAAAKANGGPVAMNPELNLPFGAMSILSRPKATNIATSTGAMPPFKSLDGVSSYEKQAPSANHHNSAPHQVAGNAQTAARVPQHPQAAQPQRSAGQQAANTPYGQDGYPSFQPPAPSSLPAPTMLPRQRDANPEQQQKLLSLFGKQPVTSPPAAPGVGVASPEQKHLLSLFGKQPTAPAPSAPAPLAPVAGSARPDQAQQLLSLFGKQPPVLPPAAPVTSEKGKGKAREATLLEQISGRAPTAQVTPLAALPGQARAPGMGGLAGGMDQSGNAAQTPISPADRSFLLGYLQSASGVTR